MTTAGKIREGGGARETRWQVWVLTLTVLSAFALALNLGGATAAHAEYPGPNPPQAPADCAKPWVILSAYGTSESTDEGHPYGTVGVNSTYIRALKSALYDTGVRDSDVTVRNLPYPASALDWPDWLPGNWGPDDYWTSMYKGRDKLVEEINFYASCPTRPTLVLLGYSQGAQVIKNAIAQDAVKGNQRNADEIGAIVNVGDASRENGQIGMGQNGQMVTLNPDYSDGTADVSRGGLMQRLDVPAVFAGFIGDGRYFDVCRTDDAVCDEQAYPGSDEWQGRWLEDFGNSAIGDNAPHVMYRDNGLAQSPADKANAARVASRTAVRAIAAAVAQRNVVHPPPDTPEEVWATNVNVRATPSTSADIVTVIPEPTTVYVKCQKHAESVTYGGITNDAWSYLPQQKGWISNIFLKGPAWMPGVPECD
ncbi:cutinase family protein [Streptomyces sp. NPDC088747]|uniref:cutinase family protein n=1 Tax=Streptomyces sp. NPDC088747 TaxID=3365886 RepID=UPI0037F27AF1